MQEVEPAAPPHLDQPLAATEHLGDIGQMEGTNHTRKSHQAFWDEAHTDEVGAMADTEDPMADLDDVGESDVQWLPAIAKRLKKTRGA